MISLNEHKLLIAGSMILLAAVIFFAGVAYFVNGIRSPYASNQVPPGGAAGAVAVLPPGTPNPADSLPQVLSITAVAGAVTAISPTSITIRAQSDQSLSTFPITKDTTIFKPGAQKSAQQYAQELKDFQTKMQYAVPGGTTYIAPDQNIEIPLTISDIAVGNVVLVYHGTTKTDSTDHALKIQFVATSTAAAQ